MGIISRFKDIMSANVNSVLSKAEGANAEKLLEKYLQDAKENLGQIKAETAAVIAEEMALARKLTENEELYSRYEGYAVAAVKSGNDNDARKFLSYNAELATKKEELAKQYETAKQNSEKMREMTDKLTSDIETAAQKLDELKQKLNVAKQQEKLNKFNDKMSSNPLGNYDNIFESVQKRIDAADAAAQLNSKGDKAAELDELAKKYSSNSQSQNTDTIEDQLQRIKSRLQ